MFHSLCAAIFLRAEMLWGGRRCRDFLASHDRRFAAGTAFPRSPLGASRCGTLLAQVSHCIPWPSHSPDPAEQAIFAGGAAALLAPRRAGAAGEGAPGASAVR